MHLFYIFTAVFQLQLAFFYLTYFSRFTQGNISVQMQVQPEDGGRGPGERVRGRVRQLRVEAAAPHLPSAQAAAPDEAAQGGRRAQVCGGRHHQQRRAGARAARKRRFFAQCFFKRYC